jgi:hypothetical protein
MIYKYLSIALLLMAANCLQAKNLSLSSTKQSQSLADLHEQLENSANEMSVASTPLIPARYGDGGTSVHFFFGIELGYARIMSKDSAGTKYAGGGFRYGGEMGMKIKMQTRNESRVGLISVSASLSRFAIKTKYKNALGESKTSDEHYGIVTLPLSYTSLNFGREGGVGYFWQIGVNLNHIAQVEDNNDKKLIDRYNSIYVEPFASFGFSTRFRLMDRWTRDEIGGGRALVGPFFSYGVTNMSKVSGMTTNGFNIGIRWTYVGM